MYNEVIEKFLNFSETTKDEKWCKEMVKEVILNAKPVITKADYDILHNVLFGKFEETELDKIMTGKAMKRQLKKLSKSTVYFFERVRNALIDERNEADLTITVNSLDPEKEMKKKSDKDLLIDRKAIESLMNEFTQNNGMPPKKFEPKDYHGNIEEFDNKGYDETDPDDLSNFFDNAWGLKAEIELNKIINPVARVNQISRDYDKRINDILICLHTFSRVSVDELEGKIKIDHLYPYEPEWLHPTDSNDFKDAQAVKLLKSTNVRGYMRKFGSTFDFTQKWKLLLNACYGSVEGSRYTGIEHENNIICGTPGQTIDFRKMMDLPIRYGYVEFKAISKKVKGQVVTKEGNIIIDTIDENNPAINGAYKEEEFFEDTYYAYYFETGAIMPEIIKWGKVYMQEFDGLNDEYSGFTIKGNRRMGIPIAKVIQPFHQIIQVSYKMVEMLINNIKPDGLIMNYSSILKVAEFLKANAKDVPAEDKSGIELFLKMAEESPNLLVDNPETDEGGAVGGGNIAVQKRENGLNQAATDLTKIIDWCESKVEKYLGTQGIEVTDPKDGYKLSIENKKRTRAATAFIDFIILNHLEDIGITILNYAQDISKFKDIPAYKYLECLVGEKPMNFIASLKKSPHRYGIFIDTFNNDIQMLEIKQRASQAMDEKAISLEQYLMVCSIKNPIQAAAYLAYERKKTMKQARINAMDAAKQQDALDEQKFQRQLKLENRKGFWMERARGQEAKGFYTAAAINAKSQLAVEQMKQSGQDGRLAATAENEIDKIVTTANANATKPAPVQ